MGAGRVDRVGQVAVAPVAGLRVAVGAPGAGGGDQSVAQAAAEGIGPPRVATGFAFAEVTPLVIHGVMYIGTPYGRVTALDPTTGKEIWSYKLPTGEPATRGRGIFPGGQADSCQLIVVGTSDAKLFTLDPKTGALNTAFGVDGFVDLDTPEITHDLPDASDGVSSPSDHVQQPDHSGRQDYGERRAGACG